MSTCFCWIVSVQFLFVQSLISALPKISHPTRSTSFDSSKVEFCPEHCYTHGWMVRVSDSTKESNRSIWNLRFIPYSNNLPKVQLVVVYLCNKDGSHCLVERCPIHVDGGSNRQHKPRNPPVHVVILQQALESDRQRGWAAKQQRTHIELFLFLRNRMNCRKPAPGRANFMLTTRASHSLVCTCTHLPCNSLLCLREDKDSHMYKC